VQVDEDKIVVIINGFKKKTQKTPTKEIDKAISIKKQYFDTNLFNTPM